MERKIADLIALLQRRYPDWTNFAHSGFMADEVDYKQATIGKAREWLNQSEVDQLIAKGDFAVFLDRLVKVCQDNNLLWRRVPSAGDTAVLHHPDLDKPAYCTQIRNLLFGDLTSPNRLQIYADYCTANQLPNKWPLPTYLLFITHPASEFFVKPRTAEWFLKFMGAAQEVMAPPTAVTYQAITDNAKILFQALQPYGVRDMVDVQSMIWVCSRESKDRVGRLSSKGQVELDVPPSKPIAPANYDVSPSETLVKENAADYGSWPENPAYSLPVCAQETGFIESELQRWVNAIERKGQAIFYGPPGTGKTFLAEKLAQHLIGGGNGFSELVQFHPAYAYEDFIQGIRPFTREGSIHYEMVPGRFMQFCEQAKSRDGRCVLIIDEINRANLASVFGELMYLLEYRNREIPLAGGGQFSLPANVLILGTMNTADRSIALVDHALRRRFAFIHLPPNYEILRHYHITTGFDPTALIAQLNKLNSQIGDPHFYIGPMYFLHPQLPDHLETIWQMEIEPYLEEYFFNQPEKAAEFNWSKIGPKIMP